MQTASGAAPSGVGVGVAITQKTRGLYAFADGIRWFNESLGAVLPKLPKRRRRPPSLSFLPTANTVLWRGCAGRTPRGVYAAACERMLGCSII